MLLCHDSSGYTPRVQSAADPQARSEERTLVHSVFPDRADQVFFVRRSANLLAEKFYRIFSRSLGAVRIRVGPAALFCVFRAVFPQYLEPITPLFFPDRP
jgi:hypothetical protein